MVCRNRWAVIVAFAGQVDQPGGGAGFCKGHVEQQGLDSSLPRTTKIGWTSRPALGSSADDRHAGNTCTACRRAIAERKYPFAVSVGDRSAGARE
jgi:hypothetical protein